MNYSDAKDKLYFYLTELTNQIETEISDNKNFDSPYFTDNLNTPDNMSKNTHTKLFELQFSGANWNNIICENTKRIRGDYSLTDPFKITLFAVR